MCDVGNLCTFQPIGRAIGMKHHGSTFIGVSIGKFAKNTLKWDFPISHLYEQILGVRYATVLRA